MKVLWVSAHLPDPTLGGGWAHEYELLKHASGRHDITVITGELDTGAHVPAVLRDLGVTVIGARAPMREIPAGPKYLTLLATADAPTGAWAFAPVRASMADAATSIQANETFDVVHVFPQESAPIVATVTGPTALLLGDSYTVQASRELQSHPNPKDRVRLIGERRNARRYERQWYPQASAVSCVSPDDAATLRALCGVDIGVVPVAVGDEWFESTSTRADDLVVLVGALDYWPNVDGTVWFCTDVWPLVRRASPHVRLRVVGRRPTEAVRDAVQLAGGELLADVPDVRPHYGEATVAVAPTRLGSGVKNKVLHAAACQSPQAGTSFAFAGTGAVAGRDVLMADDAPGLAEAVVSCLRDPDAARVRATAALDLARRHTRLASGEALEDLWARAVRSGNR